MTLEEAIQAAQAKIEENPELAQVVRDLRSNAISPERAAQAVFRETNKELVAAIEQLAGQVTNVLVFDPEVRKEALSQWGLEEEDLVFQPDPDRPMVMLNPLYQALIMEVLQFDGDLPELRTGPLPEGGTPAVPVKTQARNPVMLGLMLKSASEKVHHQLQEANQKIREALESIASDTALAPQNRSAAIRELVNKPASIPGYAPGQRAQAVAIQNPSMEQMEKLSFSEKQEMFHKALTSTQGRRSAAPVIAKLVMSKFHQEGFSKLTLVSRRSSEPTTKVSWTVSIDGWKSELNPRFSYMDNAAGSLARRALEGIKFQATKETRIELMVQPVNTVSESRVGWALSVFTS